jgi:exonuclease III
LDLDGHIRLFLSGCYFWFPMDNPSQIYSFLSWNVCGLNSAASHEDVKKIIVLYKPDLICLQETKLEIISAALIGDALGYQYENNFVFLHASGTRGGILIAAKDSAFRFHQPNLDANSITVKVTDSRRNNS